MLQNPTKHYTPPKVDFSKLRTTIYPSNIAPIGAKLWENAFQAICNISFFDAEKKIGAISFKKIGVKSKNMCFGGARIF